MICAAALVLLLDASASVPHDDWTRQVEAHAEAFEHPLIHAAIRAAGPIYVRAATFSDSTHPVTGWARIETSADAYAYARELRGIERGPAGGTNLAHALTVAMSMMVAGPRCDREVIDVVTDGEADAPSTEQARDLAARDAITINALAIGRPEAEEWLRAHAITPDGFVMRAGSWREAGGAMRRKLVVEIAAR